MVGSTRDLLRQGWPLLLALGMLGLWAAHRLSLPVHDADLLMPIAATSDEERRLFLAPAGRYSRVDIDANGRTTPSHRFRGFRARHDVHPRPGDPLCPITGTKANPACSWVVDGRRYEFCCPPCIDEFVRHARQATAPLAAQPHCEFAAPPLRRPATFSSSPRAPLP